MRNVEVTVDNSEMVIRIDLTKDFGPSKSGKTIIIASTEGNAYIDEAKCTIGLNVYKRR